MKKIEKIVILNDRASVDGWRSKNEIKEIIKQARCLVMPTLYPEPFGLVAVESVASGIPVLISSTAFLAENIHEIQVGLAFSHHVHHDLEKKIAILKEDSHFVKKLSQNGFSRWPALANTPETWFKKLENLYLNQIVYCLWASILGARELSYSDKLSGA